MLTICTCCVGLCGYIRNSTKWPLHVGFRVLTHNTSLDGLVRDAAEGHICPYYWPLPTPLSLFFLKISARKMRKRDFNMEANKSSLRSGPMEVVIFYLGVLGK